MAKNKDTKDLEDQKPKSYEEQLRLLRDELAPRDKEDIYVSSGSLALDIALGGKGWKLGRQASIVAWYGAGKTTTCLETIKQAQDSNLEYGYIDAEHSLDQKYIQDLGIDWEKFQKRLFQPDNGEQAFEMGKKLIKAGCKVLIYDSTSGMLPQKQMEGEAGDSNLGLHARLFSAQIPILHSLAAKYNCLIIYISQIREKIGVMYGSPETTQGGNAQAFFDDYRVEIRKTLEKDNGDKEDATGTTARFKIVKNKVAAPYKTGEYSIKFGKGIDKDKEILDFAVQLAIIQKSGSWFAYGDSKIGQGREAVEVFLQDNPEVKLEIKNKVLNKITI